VHYLHFPEQLETAPKGATLHAVGFEVDEIGGASKGIAHLHIIVHEITPSEAPAP
jgi:hypothetical protein